MPWRVWSTIVYSPTATQDYPQVVDSYQNDFNTWAGITMITNAKSLICQDPRFFNWNWEILLLDE